MFFFILLLRLIYHGIIENGLMSRSGDASKMVGDKKKRIYLSQGVKGLLKTKDTFIYEFKQRRICDIPEEYRRYFDITDYSSTAQVDSKSVYKAMAKRFKDEVYLIVDATEGEDFLPEDVKSLWGMVHDVKCRENHSIALDKISLLCLGGNKTSAFDIIRYIYACLFERNPGSEIIIADMFSNLNEMFEYVNQMSTMQANEEPEDFLK